MFRKFSTRSSPRHPQPPAVPSNSSSRPKSQTLIICSAALPNVAAATKPMPPEAPIIPNITKDSNGYHHPLQAELLPPETLISIVDKFAETLLIEKEMFAQLKSKCIEGAKLGHEDHPTATIPFRSILKSSHTVLTYMSWGIRHMEKASAEKAKRDQHLQSAEQMLRSLIDSMQHELNDHPTALLASLHVPNTGFILGLAHVLLALVWKMRKNTSKYVAFHLLEAFLVSPRDARQSFIPDLWSQLFRTHLKGVEMWYKKEYTKIIRSFSTTSISAGSNPCSPSSTNNTVSSVPANSAVARANSLMDLVARKRVTNSTCNEGKSVQNEHNQSKLLEKLNMKVDLLSNLYEQSLDEGTVQCARHYQDLITTYYGRFSIDQASKMHIIRSSSDDHREMHAAGTSITDSCYKQEELESNIQEADVLESRPNVDHDNVDSKVVSRGGWMGANALQLRRSLYDAIFGTVAIEETSKNRNSTLSASSQLASLLQICSKELPKVLDPLRPKVGTYNNTCTHVITRETTTGHQSAVNKPATIRDFVSIALSPEANEESPLGSFTSVLTRKETAQIINDDSLKVPYQENAASLTTTVELTELSPACHIVDDQETMPHEASAVKGNVPSKRLIDYIKDPDHRSDAKCSSAPSDEVHKAVHPLSKTSQQRRMSLNTERTKEEQPRMIKRSNSERSAPAKGRDRGRLASNDQGIKRKVTSKVSSTRGSSSRSEVLLGTSNRNGTKVEEATDVQVKYCTSLQRHQTRSSSTNNVKAQLKQTSNKENASSQALSPLEAEVQNGAGVIARHTCSQLKELANELRAVVQATRSCGSTPEGVGRCEEVLLKLSQAWLECKSTTLLHQNEGSLKEGDSASSNGATALEELTEELLFILATSDLQEAQRLALCLLSASIGSTKSCLNPTTKRHPTEKGERPAVSQLPTDPNIWQALSHLLQQQGRLPEAALLLHLLHPAQYSASCHHFLPHLLPLLLDLAQCNIPPAANSAFHHVADSYNRPFHGRLRLFGDSLKPRALALMMMSRLLAVVDGVTRLQACKHVLFPNVNALPCLLHSLDCAPSLDERAAAAFILTTCMQADHVCREHIVTHVKLTTVVALLQHSASNSSAFQTSVTFVTELIRTRKQNITEMLGCIRQDGLLNCMHALMAYLQTASIENQPPAAGLLFQLDLLLGDEQRYSVFREEALEALIAPILSESNKRASFIAACVLSTIGRSHSEQELEAWLLKKAGLGAATCQSLNKSRHVRTAAKPIALALKDEEEEQEDEEESSRAVEWDERVARALLRQGSGGLISMALAKGLQSSMAEVRKTCLLVAAWLTAHLSKTHHLDGAQYKVCKFVSATVKERMRKALQAQLQEIAAVNSGSAIVERVCAALALQNLAK